MAFTPYRDPETGRFAKKPVEVVVNNSNNINAVATNNEQETSVITEVEIQKVAENRSAVSKMAFHLVLDAKLDSASGGIDIREKLRRPRTGADFDSNAMFDPSETRTVLDGIIPGAYGLVTFTAKGKDLTKEMANTVVSFINYGWTDKETGTKFVPVYGHILDEGFMLMVDVQLGIRSLAELGLDVSSSGKAAKRLRRLFAPYRNYIWGEVIDRFPGDEGDIYEIEISDGRVIRMLVADMSRFDERQTALLDGMGICNVKGFRNKALTIQGNFGQAKGIYWHVPWMKAFDIYVFGMKREIEFTDNTVFLGSLTDLEEHDLTLDVQTLTNFGLGHLQLAPRTGIREMDRMAGILFGKDELPILDEIADLVAVSRGQDTETEWALVRMAELGIGTKAFPVGFRRLARHMFDDVINMRRGRVPMPRKFARRVYVAPNFRMFVDDSQVIDLTRDTLGGNVCLPDAPEGLIALGRNPNACSAEAVVVNNVHVPGLMKFKGHGMVFLGAGAKEILTLLNGGDMDDSVWVFWHPAYVARIKAKIAEYPVQPKLDAAVPMATPWEAFNAELHDGIGKSWNWNCFRRDLRLFTQYRESLGMFINRLTLDNQRSGDNRAVIAADLDRGTFVVPQDFQAPTMTELLEITGEWFHKHIPADYEPSLEAFVKLAKLENELRPDFLCKRAASNSDLVIDFLQQGDGDKRLIAELCAEAKEAEKTLVFPISYAKQGRMPVVRQQAANYLLVRTEACRGLEAMAIHHDGIMEDARKLEHTFKKDLPVKLRQAYCSDVTALVKELRIWWRRQFEKVKSHNGELPDGIYDRIANGEDILETVKDDQGRVVDTRTVRHPGLKDFYFNQFDVTGERIEVSGGPWSKEMRRSIAVEWLTQVYNRNGDPAVDEKNRTISVGDGIPNFMLNELMDAMEELGLTGKIVFMHLKRSVTEALDGARLAGCMVTAMNGHVYDMYDGNRLSVMPDPELPNGTWQMSRRGVIVVSEAVPELRSDFRANLAVQVADGDFTNVVF